MASSVKKLTVATVVGCLVATTSTARAQRLSPPAERFPAELDRYIATVLSQWQIPGLAIAVVRNDSTLVAKGYGVRELGRPERVDANTVFDIASLGKSFTATAAAILVDRGLLRWDDPVRRHLPTLVLPTDSLTTQVTVRDFLSHRTGLDAANTMWVPTAVRRDDVLRRMRYLRPVVPFRQTMVYSNIGYTVAGEALASAAHMSFEALLRDVVITPLHMPSTTWTYEQAATMPNVAASHANIDGRQQVVPRERQREAIAPAAAVQSSASDLTRWMRLHLNNGVLDGTRYVSDSAMREIHSVQSRIPTTPAMRAARLVQDTVIGYGMGWQIMDYRGHRVIWHSGNGDGQIAWMALFPNDKLGIAVMVNTWAAPMIHTALINRIADTYLGYPPRDWAAEVFPRRDADDSARAANRRAMIAMRSSAPPRLPLAAYAGRYDHPLFGPIWIRLAGPGLTLQMGGGRIADLEYHGADAFYVVWRDPFFREYYPTHVTFATSGDSVISFTTTISRDQFTARKEGEGAAPAAVSRGAGEVVPQSSVVALEDVTIIDGGGSPPQPRRTVVIRDGRVAEIFATGARPLPADAQRPRVAGMFVVPGLIDAHVHLTSFATRPGQDSVLALLFQSGVTTVRDMAGDAVMLSERQRVARDPMSSWPRIYYSAVMAGPTFMASDPRTVPASHGVPPGPSPWLRAIYDTTNITLAVDVAKWTGATGIKLYADLPGSALARITAEAHTQGMRVWAHAAVIPARPRDAVRAGADVLSHADILIAEALPQMPATFAAAAALRQYDAIPVTDSALTRLLGEMKDAGTLLEPTLVTAQRIAARARNDQSRRALWQIDRWSYDITRRAHDAGIPIVAGTDLMGTPGRDSLALIHDELELLVREAGLSPLQAIQSATRNGARAIGIEKDYGTIEVGKVADMVVLRGDPLADIRNTRTIAFIVKAGRLVPREGSR